uniref:Syndetin C-terminal domain-containing protein n=1 Tax=Romanomermis culicivorax TaxID=13658 RepID=A0A915IZN4_ROMCU
MTLTSTTNILASIMKIFVLIFVAQYFNNAFTECLITNLTPVFESVGCRLSLLIENVNDVTSMKLTDFVEILRLTKRFVEVGFINFSSRCSRLQDAVKRFSMKFLDWHHKACLFELKQFLFTENWHSVPLERHFTYQNLPEFAFTNNVQASVSIYSDELATYALMNLQSSSNPFVSTSEQGPADKASSIDSYAISNHDVDEHDDDVMDNRLDSLECHSMDAQEVSASFKFIDKLAPIVCNSSLNLLRLIGKYLEVAWIFSPVSFEILSMVLFVSLSRYKFNEFWDVEIYASARLKQLLTKLTVKYANEDIKNFDSFSGVVRDDQSYSDLTKFIVASESMIFIAKQMKNLESVINVLLPSNRLSFNEQFFNQILSCVDDIRYPVYGRYCFLKIKWSFLLSSIESVNWDIQELMSQHSDYVTFILQDFDHFKNSIFQTNANVMKVPKEAFDSLIFCWIKSIMRLLVEGYSSARKCTNQGRALMQLDFQNLLMQLEKRTGIKPIPDKDYVDAYVKAYYLPESSIEDNINKNTWSEYTSKQIIGLINVTNQLTRKTRSRLLAILENSDSQAIL